MPAVQVEGVAVYRQLEKVLQSPAFAGNERLCRFLSFIIEQTLDGHGHELKEPVIGVEVFGRRPGYSPKDDSIVRTEARRLRARLSTYYSGIGAGDPVLIELPKGGYVPVVRMAQDPPASSVPGAAAFPWWFRRGPRTVLAAAGLVGAVLAGIGFTRLGSARRAHLQANAQVRELYVRAHAMEAGVEGVEGSIDLFRQAIAKDPSFAPAYAGIAAGYAVRSAFDRFDPRERAQMIARGWAAAQKAVQLDPRLADAHDALGMMQAREGQWASAEQSFRRAIELAPREPLWRVHYSEFLLRPLGRAEDVSVGPTRYCARGRPNRPFNFWKPFGATIFWTPARRCSPLRT